MKTKLTKNIEFLIFQDTNKLSVSGCREVKIGTHKTKSFLTGEQEFVDYMTIDFYGEITCYEIKSSMDDLKSSARLSFLGHRNFLVLPRDLYMQVENERWFLEKLENHNIGVITLNEDNKLQQIKKCKKKKLSIGTQSLLLESFARSAARDAKKMYELENTNVKTMPKFAIEWKKNNSSKRKKFATVESVPEAIRLISKNCKNWINEIPTPYFRVYERENERFVDYGSHTAIFIISEVKEK